MKLDHGKMAEMKTLKRSLVAGATIALTITMSACSGGSGNEPAPQPPPQGQAGPAISDPKDAAAVDLCQLLPADAATSLGLNPAGEVETSSVDPDMPPQCTWKSENGATTLSLGPSKTSVQWYIDNKSTFVDFRELNIAGHPTVQGNKADPAQTQNCWMYLGTMDNQVLGAFAFGTADPCSMTQKALEASVPTLPAAK
ncbi:uncharacterized protein DUF3558 [Saccharopolyspora dendranthemae]|uniref:Uncharacterized protein DUF3558 n=2 Tax=Saccharopolyspora dendranthemae TaxID=1181886 RepID=A0A561VB27_9PSEU|nr:uncharacterized protein DUF3558 [Saccharopolyspora dendranthemae]